MVGKQKYAQKNGPYCPGPNCLGPRHPGTYLQFIFKLSLKMKQPTCVSTKFHLPHKGDLPRNMMKMRAQTNSFHISAFPSNLQQ